MPRSPSSSCTVATKTSGGTLSQVQCVSYHADGGLWQQRTFEVVARDSAQDSASRVIKSGVKAHGPLSGMLLDGVGILTGLTIELRDPNTGTVLYRGQLR